MAASPRAALLLLLLAAALLLSCCYASRATGGETLGKEAVTVPMSTDPSKCERMVPCNVDKCTEYCVRIGLGNERGFCSFLHLQFVCCCPIPSRSTPTKIPISSVKQV